MYREYVRLKYTKEDEKGFHFYQPNSSVIANKIQERKKIQKKVSFVSFLLCMTAIIIKLFIDNKWIQDTGSMMIMITIMVYIVIMLSECSKIQRIKKSKVMAFDIEIVKKLPIEEETSMRVDGPSDRYKFYPVIGQDVVTGYQSLCYLEKEQYEQNGIRNKVQILRMER